jgi:hypothetical protein
VGEPAPTRIQVDPKDPADRVRPGHCSRKLGDVERALKLFHQVPEMNAPEDLPRLMRPASLRGSHRSTMVSPIISLNLFAKSTNAE